MFGIKSAIRKLLRYIFKVSSEEIVQSAVRSVLREVLAAYYLFPFTSTYFPLTTGSLRPSCLITVVNDIIVNKRKTIVECGGGISTLIIARVIKEYGGYLLTFEENYQWAEFLKQHLAKENLEKYVSVIYTPLKPSKLALNNELWYDEAVISVEMAGKIIDLLIVDGPGDVLRRYPTIPIFKKFLSSNNYCVIVDDIPRGVNKFIDKWEKELGICFRILNDFAIATTNPDFKLFLLP